MIQEDIKRMKKEKVVDRNPVDDAQEAADIERMDQQIFILSIKRFFFATIRRIFAFVMLVFLAALLLNGFFHVQYGAYKLNKCYEVKQSVRECL